MGGEGFEPPKASANGFTVRPGSPTPASALKYKKRAINILLINKICKYIETRLLGKKCEVIKIFEYDLFNGSKAPYQGFYTELLH